MVLCDERYGAAPIPYDFDYSGMVDHDYAVPYELLPIHSVRDYLFRGHKITLEEIDAYDTLFLSPGPGVPKDAGLMPMFL